MENGRFIRQATIDDVSLQFRTFRSSAALNKKSRWTLQSIYIYQHWVTQELNTELKCISLSLSLTVIYSR